MHDRQSRPSSPGRGSIARPSILLLGTVAAVLVAFLFRGVPPRERTRAAEDQRSAAPPATAPAEDEECTLVLLSGRATPDGRPIIWKNRDAASLDNEVCYFDDGLYRYVALVNAGDGTRAWAGVNERGFAVLNSLSFNLPNRDHGSLPLGVLMKWALQSCEDVDDFRELLDFTNEDGRTNPANYAVLDASGTVSLFEAGNRSYVEYSADNSDANGNGYIVRTNFSMSADTSGSSTTRYHRCERLVADAVAAGRADLAFVLTAVARDLWAGGVDPYPLPYGGAPEGAPDAVGYVNAADAINGRATVASCTIHGVLPGEDPLLSTFYAVLGQPVVAPPLPVWVAAGATPAELDGPYTSPVCDAAVARAGDIYDHPAHGTFLNTRDLVDGSRAAHLARTVWIGDWVLAESQAALARWRADGVDSAGMAAVEARIAADTYRAYMSRATSGALRVTIAGSPNPSRGALRIRYAFGEPPPASWFLEIYDVSGRRVRTIDALGGSELLTGWLDWDARDTSGRDAPSGIYFARIAGERRSDAARFVIAR